MPPVTLPVLMTFPRRTASASVLFCGPRTRRPAARSVLCMRVTSSSSTAKSTHAVVVGGGPAGLLAAHLLLEADDNYVVTVHELRGDPRHENPTSSRQYSLGLGARGRFALQEVEGLWEAVKGMGLASSNFQLHLGSRAINIRAKGVPGQESQPSILINRGVLCGTMLEHLMKRHSDGGRLQVHFQSKCTGVDLNARTVSFEHDGAATQEDYDLLVGADGVRSVVRAAFEGRGGFRGSMELLPGKYKVLHQRMPAALAPDAVHAMTPAASKNKEDGTFGLFIIPAVGDQACMLVNWSDDKEPKLLQLTTAEEVQRCISDRYPVLGEPITLEAAEQFLQQRPSLAGVVTASTYHDEQGGQAVLLGDAAHSTGGSLGQGANSALMDVVALRDALRSCNGDVAAATAAYSAAAVPQGEALVKLLALNAPSRRRNPLMSIAYLLWSNLMQTKLSELLPGIVQPNVQTLLTQSTVPYTDIVQSNAFWIGDDVEE